MTDLILNNTKPFLGTSGKLLRAWQRVIDGSKYGLLYNWWAATTTKKISSSDEWRIPNATDITTLTTSIGGTTSSYKLRTIGDTYWNSPSNNGTDEYGFYLPGSGYRAGGFGFYQLKVSANMWLDYETTATYAAVVGMNGLLVSSGDKRNGVMIRLIKTDSTLTSYTGNDGRVYPTVKIGNQVWVTRNLVETKFRDGSLIQEITDETAWGATYPTTTSAMCAYNNDWNNV